MTRIVGLRRPVDRPTIHVCSAFYSVSKLVAHCHLGLGKLYRRTSKGEKAHEHLHAAITMYRELDMRGWLEQAEAEIKTDSG